MEARVSFNCSLSPDRQLSDESWLTCVVYLTPRSISRILGHDEGCFRLGNARFELAERERRHLHLIYQNKGVSHFQVIRALSTNRTSSASLSLSLSLARPISPYGRDRMKTHRQSRDLITNQHDARPAPQVKSGHKRYYVGRCKRALHSMCPRK